MSLKEELFSFQKEKKELENKIFHQILEQCIEQIKYENQHSKTETLFIIPKLTIGLPLNNLKECLNFLIKELKKQGLECQKTLNPYELYVSWHINENDLKNYKIKPLRQKNNTKKYDKDDLRLLSSVLKKDK